MKTFFSLLCASVLLAGCGGRDRDVAQAVKNPELQGKSFVSQSCSTPLLKEFQTLFKVEGEKTAYSFNGARIARETRYYAKNDCSGSPVFTLRETGDYSTNKSSSVKSNDGGYQLDVNWNTLEGIAHSDEGVKASDGLCGVKNWPKDKPVNLTNKAKDATCYNGELPRQDFNLMRLDDGNKTMLLGRTEKKANKANERPAKLENTKYVAQ